MVYIQKDTVCCTLDALQGTIDIPDLTLGATTSDISTASRAKPVCLAEHGALQPTEDARGHAEGSACAGVTQLI